MNKKEKEIILNKYELIFRMNETGIDKSDSVREVRFLLDQFGLEKERYEVENKVIAYCKDYSPIVLDAFEMLFDSFKKHGHLVNYDIDEIEVIFEELKWDMSSEESNYNLKRISIIKDALSVNA